MTGVYKHSLDNKGRIFIPTKLREDLGDMFFITVSVDNCLCAYSAADWKGLTDKVNSMPYINQRKMRPLYAYASRCDLDAQGRVLIPQGLRNFAGLVKDVTVVGCNNHIEFWDSGTWESVYMKELSPENLAAAMKELNF